jgi:hypothetical protein
MRDAEFEAVFGSERVTGRTDNDGFAVIEAPAGAGDTYRLVLRSYPAEQVVRGA